MFYGYLYIVSSQFQGFRGRAVSFIRSHWIELLVLVAVALPAYLLFPHRPMKPWDEASYVTIAHYASAHGEWLVPHLSYHVWNTPKAGVQPFLEKPPLGFWIQAISMSIFGQDAFAARLPAIIFTLGTTSIVYLLATELYTRPVGVLSAAIFAATPQILVESHGGRSATLDPFLLFFGMSFLTLMYIGLTSNRRKLLPVAGVAFGCAMLTKGFGAGIFALIMVPIALQYWDRVVSYHGVAMIAIAIAIPLPWIIAVGLIHPELLNTIVQNQIINRISGNLTTVPASFDFMMYPYFRRFPQLYDPWAYLFVPAVIGLPIVQYLQNKKTALWKTLFIAWWAIFTFMFFVLTGNHSWYIQPMAPAVAILSAMLIIRATKHRILQLLLQISTVGIAFYSTRANFVVKVVDILPEAEIRAGFLVTGLLFVFALSKLNESPLQNISMANVKMVLAGSLAILAILQASVVLWYAGPINTAGTQQQMEIGQEIQIEGGEAAPILIHESVTTPLANLAFYSDRATEPASINDINTAEEGRYAVITEDNAAEITRSHSVIGSIESWYSPTLQVIKLETLESSRSMQTGR